MDIAHSVRRAVRASSKRAGEVSESLCAHAESLVLNTHRPLRLMGFGQLNRETTKWSFSLFLSVYAVVTRKLPVIGLKHRGLNTFGVIGAAVCVVGSLAMLADRGREYWARSLDEELEHLKQTHPRLSLREALALSVVAETAAQYGLEQSPEEAALVQDALDLEARYLDDLGRHDEAEEVRRSVPRGEQLPPIITDHPGT